jgi:hypothetical protein
MKVHDDKLHDSMKKEIKLDATQWFIELMIHSTCFGHYYAHHQELETIQCLQPVAHNLCYTWSWVWCVAVGCSSNIPQPGHITYSHAPDPRPAITKVMHHRL